MDARMFRVADEVGWLGIELEGNPAAYCDFSTAGVETVEALVADRMTLLTSASVGSADVEGVVAEAALAALSSASRLALASRSRLTSSKITFAPFSMSWCPTNAPSVSASTNSFTVAEDVKTTWSSPFKEVTVPVSVKVAVSIVEAPSVTAGFG